MRNPQVINTNLDAIIVVDGENVIKDSDQSYLSGGVWAGANITVNITLLNISTGLSSTVIVGETLIYDSASDFWYVDLVGTGTPTLLATFNANDRTKFVARVVENSTASDMRPFKFTEFVIDNDSFEDTWMRLPYQVVISATSKIIWYEDTTWAVPLFEAEVYQDGVGTTSATDASRVTHRGPIVAL